MNSECRSLASLENKILAEWRTEIVRGLARGILEDGAFDRMPILADALQDVGCEDQTILNHCRTCAYHEPDCWLVVQCLKESVPSESTSSSSHTQQKAKKFVPLLPKARKSVTDYFEYLAIALFIAMLASCLLQGIFEEMIKYQNHVFGR